MRIFGLTKTRSMGPVGALIERSGGSIAHVFKRAKLPLRLIEEPDQLILLKDQLNLVDCAAREIGDETLPARLSTEAGIVSLGGYGMQVANMPNLNRAITCANTLIGPLLQSATRLALIVENGYAKWTYGLTAPIVTGRQQNEMLAFGYMLDLIRRFAGPAFTPTRLELPGGLPLATKSAVETVFRAEISRRETAAIIFPAEVLNTPNLRPRRLNVINESELPDATNIIACVERLIILGLLDGRPSITEICRRMQISRRTLQRNLNSSGASFDALLRRALMTRAVGFLRNGRSVTDVAFELGYADTAHFSRAFRRWTGQSPRQWCTAHAQRR